MHEVKIPLRLVLLKTEQRANFLKESLNCHTFESSHSGRWRTGMDCRCAQHEARRATDDSTLAQSQTYSSPGAGCCHTKHVSYGVFADNAIIPIDLEHF